MTDMIDRLSAALSGRYRIERELGTGGMATVYLAADLKHDRKVAIKVLKPELAAVLGAERFVVEIKTTASLSHPHILPLFDSGTADGFLFYVMPFIEGETIREKLTRETQFGVDEAVRIAREVADALDYAHRHGVIHRDIKPENLLLHDGRAMVMDFGIALAVSAAAGGRMTETGLSLGTPHYMSPEQATAEKEITARTDQYSLASVLYEMLAGQPPHIGGAAQAVIMKIITEPAQSVTALRKSVPPNVADALSKALEKLPADRFESAAKFAEALQNSGFVSRSAGASSSRAASRPRIGGRALATIVAALLVVAAWGWLRPPSASDQPNMRVLIDFPEGRGPIFQPGGAFDLSPDASRLVYMGGGQRAGGSGSWRLWIRPIDALTADSVPGSEFAHSVVWSAGGDSIAFMVGGEIRVYSTLPGGGVATVRRGDRDELYYGLSWSRDGGILFATSRGVLRVIPSAGAVDTLFRATGSGPHFAWPHWVDGGREFTFTVIDRAALSNRVVLARGDGSARLDTLTDGMNGQVLADGDLLWAADNGTVFTAPVDISRGELAGGRAQLLTGAIVEPGMELRLSTSQRGAVVYALTSTVQSRSHLVIVNRRTGERIELPRPPGTRLFPDLHLSPDGRRLAISASRGVSHEIWVYQVASGQVDPFTVTALSNNPVWSRDGEQLSYCGGIPIAVWQRPADKLKPAVHLAPPVACPRSWDPTGKVLLLESADPPRMWSLTPPDSVMTRLAGSADGEFAPAVSPDGRWLAYTAVKSGTAEVWVRGFRAPGGPWPVSRGGGFDPVWGRDGRSLFFRTDSAIVMAEVSSGDQFNVGAARRVAAASSSVAAIYGQSFDVFPDGERLVLFESGNGASVEQLILETNLLGKKRKP